MRNKLTIMIIMLLAIAGNMVAQNANKSGVFIEGGVGFGMGNLPMIVAAKVEGSEIKLTKANGFGFNLATGYRYTYTKASAFELKLKYATMVKSVAATSAIKVMPGYKYFTSKALGNTYFGVNVGVVVSSKGSTNKQGYVETAKFLNPMSVGLAYELQMGKVLTRNQYIGLCWEYQDLKGNSTKGYEMRDYGMLGVQYGYRF